MKISQEVREIETAKQAGMAAQAARFRKSGQELYLTADATSPEEAS